MQWQNNPYFAALLVAGLISFINAWYCPAPPGGCLHCSWRHAGRLLWSLAYG
jgi:hypothetical protein